MTKEPGILANHILECIDRINQYLADTTKDQFLRSVQLQDAVIRRIEVIGEAVKNIPTQVKDRYHEIAWKDIAGMRDILIHAYFGIDLELTWRVATQDLPRLKIYMLRVKEDLEHKKP